MSSSRLECDPTPCGVAKGDLSASGRESRCAADRRGWDDARALAALTRYLRRGVRSTQEALAYLRRLRVPGVASTRLVKVFRARGMLDDAACARLWAEHWARQGYAWGAIRARLSAKGLDEQLIHQTGKQLGTSSDDEEARAKDVAVRVTARFRTRRPRARVGRTLASRGFDADVIERVLNDTFASSPSDAEP